MSCKFCKKANHNEKNCWKRQNKESANSTKISKAKGEIALTAEIRHYGLNTEPMQDKLKASNFIIDSGASKHMCGHKNQFSTLTYKENLGMVHTANDERLKIKGIGEIKIRPTNTQDTLTLKEVLYVPELEQNLFSVSACTSRNQSIKVEFSDKEVTMTLNGKTIIHGSRIGNLYKLKSDPIMTAYITTRSGATTKSKSGPPVKTPTLTLIGVGMAPRTMGWTLTPTLE